MINWKARHKKLGFLIKTKLKNWQFFYYKGLVADGNIFDVSVFDNLYTYEPNMISNELFRIYEEIKQGYLMFIGVLYQILNQW